MIDPASPYLRNSQNTIWSPLATKQVPAEHPRLLGSRERLQGLAKERPDAYRRTREIANRPLGPALKDWDASADFGGVVSVHCQLISMGLVCAIERDEKMGRAAIDLAFGHFVNKPPRVGHEVFGDDVGNVAWVYDLCHEHWTADERKRYHDYIFACRDSNVDEEMSPFHNGWYGYKNAGFVLGALATVGETERELVMLFHIDREYRTLAADCLRLAGDGGGYGEGFYVNYWLYQWLLASEAMRHCTGADYLAEAPAFFRQRAIASAFEQFPGIRERGSRRPLAVGDGRGRFFKVERDRNLAANHILVSHYREDPDHQAVNAFLNKTPHVGADENAYMELLWFDPNVKQGDLSKLRLSHVSKGPGYVYARSSWDEDATWFFFKCGNRYTAHQHLDVGHFFIVKHEELAGEGGHYDTFGGTHDTNYYARTIAHNSVLVHDPNEVFAAVRGRRDAIANDGGQAYPWPGTMFRHNGDGWDADTWRRGRHLMDIADLLAFHDAGDFFYTAGDCTRAYAREKLEWFTRQIVFIRPGTFVIFDRVKSTNEHFRKTWLLHAGKPPVQKGSDLVITNGRGRLHVQTVLPASPVVRLNQGDDLYRYAGGHFPPLRKYGVETECRIEISPPSPAKEDVFLHVLTATDAAVDAVPRGAADVRGNTVTLRVDKATITFHTDSVGGSITFGGRTTPFANQIHEAG